MFKLTYFYRDMIFKSKTATNKKQNLYLQWSDLMAGKPQKIALRVFGVGLINIDLPVFVNIY